MSIQPIQIGSDLFKVRAATSNDDVMKIVEVINRAFKRVVFFLYDRTSLPEIEKILSDPQKVLYLCLSPTNEICGTVLLDYFEKDKVKAGYFAIDPDFQKKGIGPQFMSRIEEEAFKKVQEIVITVIPVTQEKLIKSYQHYGYAFTGEMQHPTEAQKAKITLEYRDQVRFCTMKKCSLQPNTI